MLCVGSTPVVCNTRGVGAKPEFYRAAVARYDMVGIGFACTALSSVYKSDSRSTPGISAGL